MECKSRWNRRSEAPLPRETGPMLEVRPEPDGFTVYDSDACEAVIKFASRAEADELIAMLQIEEAHAQLKGWSPDAALTSS